jgi:fatty-acid desaturase
MKSVSDGYKQDAILFLGSLLRQGSLFESRVKKKHMVGHGIHHHRTEVDTNPVASKKKFHESRIGQDMTYNGPQKVTVENNDLRHGIEVSGYNPGSLWNNWGGIDLQNVVAD